ncbi:hypothetical protein BH23ACI1_BH23ACI1_21030 [soil metagenome]|nr:hypothetical protein [Acidobacteriota bacterium]
MAGGCEAQKSENPLSPNVAGPIAGVSISVPAPVTPANGAEVLNSAPVRLTFANSSSNGVRPLWYVVELSGDSNFSSRIFTHGRVLPAEGPQTSVIVEATLNAEATYFWRVRANDGANASEFSAAAHFDLVVPVSLGPPLPVSPAGGETTASRTPTLTLNNGTVTGRAGTVEYRFEIATNQAFTAMAATRAAVRSSGGTTSAQAPELPANTLFYWRAWATNGTVHGPVSPSQSFRTPAAPTPGPGPGPAPGPAPPASNVTPETMPSYLAAFSQGNPEWAACQAGSGTACFRFVWDVAQSVNPTCNASGWGLLSKNPGEWQCTRSGCGGLGGQGFGEDILTYGSSSVRIWDVIVGAGAQGASLGFSEISSTRRPGNNWACPWR